eukprot:m.27895 g.27895  ORF g.27895 m.27895 type:complete len:328 (-) comp5992_c0_seq1:2902-3885(-)
MNGQEGDGSGSGSDGGESIGWNQLNKPMYFGLCGSFFFAFETLTYPIDFLKTRQQHAQHPLSLSAIVNNVLHREGVRGFFRGYTTAITGSIPGQLLYFGSYEYARMTFEKFIPQPEQESVTHLFASNLVAGFFADIAAIFLQTPFDVVSQRAMISASSHPKDLHPLSIVKTILKTNGPSGIYRGLGASILTFAPSSAIWFATYELSKHTIKSQSTKAELVERVGKDAMEHSTHLLSGSIAGAISTIIMNPMDVTRTRIQTFNPSEEQVLGRNIVSVIMKTVKQEGMGALFKGLVPRLWFGIVGSAITFTGYEWAKKIAQQPSVDIYT